jgi:polar amino acid transport system substrate-binding protein
MKKYFALLLAGMMAVSLAACGGSSSASTAPAETEAETEAEVTEEGTTEAEAPAETGEETAAITTVEEGVLHMATNAAFPPYEMISDDGGFEGIDVEIATEIARKLGLELVVDDMEFGSVITSVQSGKSDIAMAGLTVTEERKQSVNFSTPDAKGVQVVIVKENSSITCADDFFNLDAEGNWESLKDSAT